MCDWSDVFERKRLELVLLEEIIQILLQHLENEAGVVFVREALVGSNKVEFVCIFLAEKKENGLIGMRIQSHVDLGRPPFSTG